MVLQQVQHFDSKIDASVISLAMPRKVVQNKEDAAFADKTHGNAMQLLSKIASHLWFQFLHTCVIKSNQKELGFGYH